MSLRWGDDWIKDHTNQEAQQFYEELGVPVNRSKLFYRVEYQQHK